MHLPVVRGPSILLPLVWHNRILQCNYSPTPCGEPGYSKHPEGDAASFNRPLVPDMVRLREEGKSFQEIAEWLSGQDLTTINGKPFSPKTVFNILKRSQV